MQDNRKNAPAYFEPSNDWTKRYERSIQAVQAVFKGEANADQQQAALGFITEILCNRLGNQYFESQRDTDFALGRKWVGDMIAGAVTAKLGKLEDK